MNKENSIIYQLKTLINLLHRNIEKNYCPFNKPKVSIVQFQILHYLIENEGKDIYHKDIEKKFDLRKSTVSGIIQNMEKNDFIIRESIGNQKKIKITDKTKNEAKKHKEMFIEFDEKIKKNIDKKKLEIFFEVIEQIKKNID